MHVPQQISINARFYRMLLGCFLLVWGGLTSVYAQDLLRVGGMLKDEKTNKKLPGVEVIVTQDGKPFDQYLMDSRATYSFELPLRHDYVFTFVLPGYGSKKIRINGKDVPSEDRRGGFTLDMDMSLFTLVDGFDTSILDTPFGIAAFDSQKNTVAFDYAHTERMKNRVQQELVRLEQMKAQLAQMRKDFDALILRGDQAMAKSQWTPALDAYNAALAIFPNDAVGLAKRDDAKAKADAAAAAAAEEKRFQDLLARGNQALAKDELSGARTAFQDAAAMRPTAREPQDGLARVAAREAEMGANAKYDGVVTSADRAFREGQFQQALKLYNEATELKPGERYPREQAASCQSAIQDAAAATAALAERAARYEELIKLADKNFKASAFTDALGQYREAAGLLPAERYPQERITLCEQRIAEAGTRADREAAAQAAAASEAERRAQYDAAIRAGDEAFLAQRWDAAAEAYRRAQAVLPEERYPGTRLERIAKEQERLAAAAAEQDAARSRADAEAQRAAEAAAAAQSAADRAASEAADKERRRLEAEAAEDARRAEREAAEEAARNHARQVAASRQGEGPDEAERYYQEALESEERSRLVGVQKRREGDLALRNQRSGEAQERVQGRREALESQSASMDAVQVGGEAASVRRQADAADRSDRAQAHGAAVADRAAGRLSSQQGEVDRQHRLLAATGEEHGQDHRARRARPDREAQTFRELDGDWDRSARERRAMAREQARAYDAAYRTLGEGTEDRLAAYLAEAERLRLAQENLVASRQHEAASRGWDERGARLGLDAGSPPSPDDFRLQEGDADVPPGIQEQSYDIPNGLVIERTVRRGNQVRHFRKVVTKTGVYYFEDDRSITADRWQRETTVIPD